MRPKPRTPRLAPWRSPGPRVRPTTLEPGPAALFTLATEASHGQRVVVLRSGLVHAVRRDADSSEWATSRDARGSTPLSRQRQEGSTSRVRSRCTARSTPGSCSIGGTDPGTRLPPRLADIGTRTVRRPYHDAAMPEPGVGVEPTTADYKSSALPTELTRRTTAGYRPRRRATSKHATAAAAATLSDSMCPCIGMLRQDVAPLAG